MLQRLNEILADDADFRKLQRAIAVVRDARGLEPDFALTNVYLARRLGAGVAIGNSLMSLSYHTYQSELFPTPMRARAIGFVYSFSRLSAIFSSYIIAATLDRAGSVGVFVRISMAMVVVALTVGLFGPRTRGLALEHI